MLFLAMLLAAFALGCGWAGAAQEQGIEIRAMDSDGANARMVAAIDGYPTINSPEVSPDGKRICFKGVRLDGSVDIAIVSATGGEPTLKRALRRGGVQSGHRPVAGRNANHDSPQRDGGIPERFVSSGQRTKKNQRR